MSNIKGTDLVNIRKLIENADSTKKEAFEKKLSPAALTAYRALLPITWTSMQTASEIIQVAAEALFPGDPEGIRHLGKECADQAFRGLYKILLKIPTLELVFAQGPKIWKQYHDQGTAKVVQVAEDKKSAVLLVENCPDATRVHMEFVAGFTARTLEMAGAKDVRIRLDNENPEALKWVTSWK